MAGMVARNVKLELDDTIDLGLKRLAESMGRTEEEIVQEAVRRHILENGPRQVPKWQPGESLYDALKRADLIGCVKNAPPDLSTNPKYMEGFGE